MIIRIAFGVILGSVFESFQYTASLLNAITIAIVAMIFVLDSATYDIIYGLWAICEISAGFALSSYLRAIRESHGY